MQFVMENLVPTRLLPLLACLGTLYGLIVDLSISLLSSTGTNTLYALYYPCEMWCISETMTAMRALAIIAVLRAMSLFEGESKLWTLVITSLTPCRNRIGRSSRHCHRVLRCSFRGMRGP